MPGGMEPFYGAVQHSRLPIRTRLIVGPPMGASEEILIRGVGVRDSLTFARGALSFFHLASELVILSAAKTLT